MDGFFVARLLQDLSEHLLCWRSQPAQPALCLRSCLDRPMPPRASPICPPSLLAADFAPAARGGGGDRGGRRRLAASRHHGRAFRAQYQLRPAGAAEPAPAHRMPFDVHLMIAPVDPFIAAFAEAGADHHHGASGSRAASAPHAAADPIARQTRRRRAESRRRRSTAIAWVLDLVDIILVMTVNPGFGGQAFLAVATAEDRGAAPDDRRLGPHDRAGGGWRHHAGDGAARASRPAPTRWSPARRYSARTDYAAAIAALRGKGPAG